MSLSLKRVLPRWWRKCVRQTPVHSSRDAPVSRRQWARGSDEALPDERMMLCFELYSVNALFSFNCPKYVNTKHTKAFDPSAWQESEIFGEPRSSGENGFFRRASNACPAACRVCGPLPLVGEILLGNQGAEWAGLSLVVGGAWCNRHLDINVHRFMG